MSSAVDLLSNSASRLVHNDSCAAYRVHSTFIDANFNHTATVAEIAALQITPYACMGVALIIALVGHRILRPSVAVLAFSVGSIATLHATFEFGELHNWSCDAVVAASLLAGAIMTLFAAWVVRCIAMLLGAMAGGAFVVLLFDICQSCNEPLWPDAPLLLGRTLLPFWLSFLVGAAAGACACRSNEKKVLAFVTSVIGGWGASVSLRLACGARGVRMPSWAGLLVAAGVTMTGFGTQLYVLRRSARRQRDVEADAKRDEECKK